MEFIRCQKSNYAIIILCIMFKILCKKSFSIKLIVNHPNCGLVSDKWQPINLDSGSVSS